MKKSRFVLSGLTVALLGASAAFAAPHMPPAGGQGQGPRRGGPGFPPPPPHQMQRADKRIPDSAPEEIKNAYKEMRSLRKDLNLELRKDAPDAAKAMEMLKKSEELHMKVREWEVKQILDGNAPKPKDGFAPRPQRDREGRPDGRPGPKPEFGPRPGGCMVPPPHGFMMWGPCGPQMMPPHHPGFAPAPGCRCGAPERGPKHFGPAPEHGPKRPDPAPENAPTPQQTPVQEKAEDAKL